MDGNAKATRGAAGRRVDEQKSSQKEVGFLLVRTTAQTDTQLTAEQANAPPEPKPHIYVITAVEKTLQLYKQEVRDARVRA